MSKLLTPKNLLIASLFVGVLVIISIIFNPKPPLPKLIASDPAEGANQVDPTKPIALKFDSVISADKVSVTSSPAEDWEIQNNGNMGVILKSKQFFHADATYSLSILHEGILISTLNFKTIHLPGDPRYVQSVAQEMERDYPLAVKVPYETNGYQVIYSAPLTLEITLINELLTNDQAVDQVRDWVRENGRDPATHKYTVVPFRPTPTPQPSP